MLYLCVSDIAPRAPVCYFDLKVPTVRSAFGVLRRQSLLLKYKSIFCFLAQESSRRNLQAKACMVYGGDGAGDSSNGFLGGTVEMGVSRTSCVCEEHRAHVGQTILPRSQKHLPYIPPTSRSCTSIATHV